MSSRTLFILIYGSFLLAIILPALADYFSRIAPRKEGDDQKPQNPDVDYQPTSGAIGMNPSSSIIYTSEIEQLRQQLASRNAEVAELKNNVTICVVRIEDLRQQLDAKDAEIKALEIEVSRLRQVRDAVLDCEGVEMRNCYEVPTEAWEAVMSFAIRSAKE